MGLFHEGRGEKGVGVPWTEESISCEPKVAGTVLVPGLKVLPPREPLGSNGEAAQDARDERGVQGLCPFSGHLVSPPSYYVGPLVAQTT